MVNLNISDLYKDLMPNVYRFVSFKLRNKEDAEDAVSEVFLRFVKSGKVFNNSEEAKAWLFGITHNVLLERYREIYKFNKIDFKDEDIVDKSNMENIALDKTTVEKIEQLLKELGEPYLSVISLRLWEEMEFKEISESLNISLSNAKMAYYRGIEKLKQMLGETEEGKKLRSIAILPLVISAMNILKSNAKYAPTDAFSKNLFNQLNLENMNISRFILSKQILIGVSFVAVTVSIVGTIAFLNSNNLKNTTINEDKVISTPVKSVDDTEETNTITKPMVESTIKTVTDSEIPGLAFDYDSSVWTYEGVGDYKICNDISCSESYGRYFKLTSKNSDLNAETYKLQSIYLSFTTQARDVNTVGNVKHCFENGKYLQQISDKWYRGANPNTAESDIARNSYLWEFYPQEAVQEGCIIGSYNLYVVSPMGNLKYKGKPVYFMGSYSNNISPALNNQADAVINSIRF